MKVVIAGGSGLIGRALASALSAEADVVVLSRAGGGVPSGRAVAWKPGVDGPWVEEVSTADAVVNLAGAGIADRRWSEARKRELRDSRIEATRAVVDALGRRSLAGRPVLVSASAVGYYGSRGDEELDENSAPGEGFLTELSLEWEAEARKAESFARVVIPRIGIVLSLDGGALRAMLPVFRLGLGGPLGSGRQWMSWIHIDDVVGIIRGAIAGAAWQGPVNTVAPEPVRNAEFTRALGSALGRPAFLPAPGFAIRAFVGEMAAPLLLTGQRVIPRRAAELGYQFRHPALGGALASVLGR
jgi:uncharacterized protein